MLRPQLEFLRPVLRLVLMLLHFFWRISDIWALLRVIQFQQRSVIFISFRGQIAKDEKFIPELVELHRSGDFPIERLCKTYPIAQLDEAIHDMHFGEVSLSPMLFVYFISN